ncbi:MAG TPA: 16S rRNA (cytidine(1402)-2'-O)-methyltransferase [Candidatus Polarisedimenticolaceae bacterium]|nr:16S rRNA (cytidine(1402)-2'-O)-methyltransferase [Candidatus Polarisedimenticolaceae bacterium]
MTERPGGVLHVVATPIGNLDDLSPRAREALASASLVACEDTRRTAKLLARFELTVPMLPVHKFSERETLAEVLAVLAEGKAVALVSDGGTPAISDPGALLVEAALDAGFRISPVPGPSAVVTLLSASGLPADRFVFDGFLPAREGERRKRLRALATETRTVVVYEAPHRIRAALDDLASILGARTVVLGRELTKIHETIVRGTAVSIAASLGDGEVRGEIVLAIAGADETGSTAPEGDETLRRTWEEALAAADGDERDALKAASKALGLKKPEVWRRLAELGLVRA